nr:protein dispatched homolog 3-like [Paramormyrops kingsleyae]
METEDEPLLLLADPGVTEEVEEEEGEEEEDFEDTPVRCDHVEDSGLWGIWRAMGWVYTQVWVCILILGAGVLLPCALCAYMFLHCPPLDIDLSYSAFEVRSHSSAQRFDALTIALKSQLGSWDRHRRDVGSVDTQALRDLLLKRLGGRNSKGPLKATKSNLMAEGLAWNTTGNGGSREEATGVNSHETHSKEKGIAGEVQQQKEEGKSGDPEDDGGQGKTLLRLPRFAGGSSYYLQSQAMWKMELVFLAQGEDDANIFTPERLRTIHQVERLVVQHPHFRQFCWRPLEILRDLPLGPSYCSPPSSLLSYLFPSERGGKIYYDGMGPDLANISGALSLAITHPQFYWYVDESLTPSRLRSSLLRSEIHFGAPLPSFFSLQDRLDEQKRRFRSFVVQYADILARQSTSQVKVLYGGTELFDDEVRRTFHNDMLLALVSGPALVCLSGNSLSSLLPLLHPNCQGLPQPNLLPGQLSHGAVGMQGGTVRWLSMAFESTTYKGKSSFQTHSDFLQWESFLQEQFSSLPASSALRHGFQTCEHWKQIFMEILGVESALYSLLLSLAICIGTVSVFTSHPFLLLPILLTILGVICLVVAVMYWLGWEMGAVEAISLSILVGSSVDYCLHLVEGFLLAGETGSQAANHHMDASELRQHHTMLAVDHVGVAIVSSAVTTVISTVPLFFCVIVPFAKFGQIVAINTAASILFTLTVSAALLATLGPAHFSRPSGAVLKAIVAVVVAGAFGAALYWVWRQFLGPIAWYAT